MEHRLIEKELVKVRSQYFKDLFLVDIVEIKVVLLRNVDLD